MRCFVFGNFNGLIQRLSGDVDTHTSISFRTFSLCACWAKCIILKVKMLRVGGVTPTRRYREVQLYGYQGKKSKEVSSVVARSNIFGVFSLFL